MTDTPDALTHDLILKYGRWLDTGKHNVDSPQRRAFFEERDAIHARLKAGDAAIKRVAELEKELDNAHALHRKGIDAHIEAHVAAKSDLAAARADIERKDTIIELVKQDHAAMNARLVDALIEIERRGAALREITERRPLDVMAASYIAAKALAPKETNNG
jgi:hypothetical protein